jgi:hypothetical protein
LHPLVWDALNRATATISRRPESDGPQANGDGFSAVDYTEAKWAIRKDGKPTVVDSSLFSDFLDRRMSAAVELPKTGRKPIRYGPDP